MQVNKQQLFDVSKPYADPARDAPRPERASEAGSSAAAGQTEDQVSTSQRNALLELARRTDSAQREQRIEQLRQAIESGTYTPDPGAVARAVVNEVLGLPAEDPGGDT